jgi:TonB family protein
VVSLSRSFFRCRLPAIALSAALLSGVEPASAQTLPSISFKETEPELKAKLFTLTDTAFHTFDRVYKKSGMVGLAEAVQKCFVSIKPADNAAKSLYCVQLDALAYTDDTSQGFPEDLRTPYFTDLAESQRRHKYLTAVVGDERMPAMGRVLQTIETLVIERELGPAPKAEAGSSDPQNGATGLQYSPDAVIVFPDWSRRPTPAELASVYPERARRAHQDGQAVLHCRIDENGVPRDCSVAVEQPEGWGFGEAAVRATRFMLMTPKLVDGHPVGDGTATIPIAFQAPR